MAPSGPSQEWLNATAKSVVESYRRVNLENPFTGNDKGLLFDGEIPSSRDPSTTYHVLVTDRQATCTCPGFTTYHRGRDCSHIKKVKVTLQL